MPSRLFIDEIVSVGAVSAGDNPEAEITFWKSQDQENRQTVVYKWKGDRMDEFNFDGFSDEQREAVETAFTSLEGTIADQEKAIADLAPVEKAEPDEVDVVKAASPEVQELFAKQQAQLEKAEAEIAKERQIRRDSEFSKKAETLATVLGEGDWGPTLDAIQAAAPEEFGKLEARLLVVKEQMDTSNLFAELGVADRTAGRMDVLVKEKMAVDPSLTPAQARADLWLEHPELVEEVRQ